MTACLEHSFGPDCDGQVKLQDIDPIAVQAPALLDLQKNLADFNALYTRDRDWSLRWQAFQAYLRYMSNEI